MNEYHVVRKSHDATQKDYPHAVPRDWFETNSRHPKRYSEGGKKLCGSRGLLGRVVKIINRLSFDSYNSSKAFFA